MICPNCRTRVADGAAICDDCNFILDASFLGGDITNEADVAPEPTRIKAAPPIEAERTRIVAPGAVPAAASSRAGKKAPVAAKPVAAVAAEPIYSFDDDESTAAGERRASLDDVAAPPAASAEAFEDLAAQFRSLPGSEKFSAVGAGLLLLSLALPWRSSTANGEDIGMLTGAAPLVLVPFAMVAVLVLRRHPRLRRWRDTLLQSGAALGLVAAAGCLVFMRSALVVEKVRAGRQVLTQASSWPAFGVYLGLFAALLLLGGAIKSYVDRETLPA